MARTPSAVGMAKKKSFRNDVLIERMPVWLLCVVDTSLARLSTVMDPKEHAHLDIDIPEL
jgi:hypothetical protein